VSVLQQLAPFCQNISHRSGARLCFPRLQNAYHVAQFHCASIGVGNGSSL
jgi:hypothetical protein